MPIPNYLFAHKLFCGGPIRIGLCLFMDFWALNFDNPVYRFWAGIRIRFFFKTLFNFFKTVKSCCIQHVQTFWNLVIKTDSQIMKWWKYGSCCTVCIGCVQILLSFWKAIVIIFRECVKYVELDYRGRVILLGIIKKNWIVFN